MSRDGITERRAFLRKVTLAGIANEHLEQLAVATFPTDIYLQTVMVTGIDPLLEIEGGGDDAERQPQQTAT